MTSLLACCTSMMIVEGMICWWEQCSWPFTFHSNSQQKKVSHSLQKLSGGIIDAWKGNYFQSVYLPNLLHPPIQYKPISFSSFNNTVRMSIVPQRGSAEQRPRSSRFNTTISWSRAAPRVKGSTRSLMGAQFHSVLCWHNQFPARARETFKRVCDY